MTHPRNRHTGHYDFDALIRCCPELAACLVRSPTGTTTIDFGDPGSVRLLNRALLAQQYGIQHWNLPDGWLCPPVPGRADYLHGLADLLVSSSGGGIPRGRSVRVLDIGVGANCIYPLLGHAEYGWEFVGTDVDPAALQIARALADANAGIGAAIELRLQARPDRIFAGVLAAGERFDLTMCNPPFHASAREAAQGSQRKWRNLGRDVGRGGRPTLNFGGRSNELWCSGGEPAFLRRMVRESVEVRQQVRWFTSLVSKASNVAAMRQQLASAGARDVRVCPMAQGQKQSRFVAWTFADSGGRQPPARR